MTQDLIFAYITAVFILLVSPGPSHLLMLSNSLSCGFSRSWATAVGDLTANSLQIAVASTGLVGLLYTSRNFFITVKWAGVAYLVYLGIGQFRRKNSAEITTSARELSRRALYWQGFVTSAANPKAVVFFAALFPQFIDPAQPTSIQFLTLGSLYLVIDGCFLLFYGFFSDWISRRYQVHIEKYSNRISGILLIATAVLLGLKDIQTVR